MTTTTKQRLHTGTSIVLLVCAAITLFLAQSAYWVNHSIFNQTNFTQTTTSALLSQSSRDAIATAVVDTSLSNRPIIQKVVGGKATSLVSGLLGSDFSNQAITSLTNKAYAYTTAKDRQDIAIDLTSIKTPLAAIVSVAQNNGVNVSSGQFQIPDQIVLVQSNAFPNLSGVVKLMLWLGPLLWLGTILLFGLYIYLGRAACARRIYIVGIVIIIVAIFGLLTKPFIPPPIAAAVPNINLRPVIENVTAGFLAPFVSQMKYMLGFTLVLLLIFNQRFNILALINSLGAKVSRQARKR
jgi:hypothetical protein